MPLAFWIAVAFLVFVIGDFIFAVIVQRKMRNLIEIHKLELRIAKENSYKQGVQATLYLLPIVQHCNKDTNYELIRHRWDPMHCNHCLVCKDLLES